MKALTNTLKALIKPKYWPYFIPSVILTFFFALVSEVTKLIFSWVEGIESISGILETTGNALFTLGTFALKFALVTLLSPMLAYLSEKIDQEFNGFDFKYTLQQFVWAILRSLAVAIVAVTVQFVLIAILALPLWFVNDIAFTMIILILSSLFLGFAFFDYSLERYRFKLGPSFQWFLKHLPICFLVGFIFNLATFVPLQFKLHWLYYMGIAFMPVTMTIFATLLYTSSITMEK